MNNEKDNLALIRYEPQSLTPEELAWAEEVARKRAELRDAIQKGIVQDPFSATVLISIAVSAAVSAASYALTYFLTPKPKPQRVGQLTGSLQLQNSEQGLFIPEIYGAGPTLNSVAGVVPTYQNVVNASVGGGGAITKNAGGSGSWNAHATTTASVLAGKDSVIRWNAGAAPVLIGFATTPTPTSPTDILFGVILNRTSYPGLQTFNAIQPWNGSIQGADIGEWATGDPFQVEIRGNRFRAFDGVRELPMGSVPVPTYPLYPCVMMYDIGAGPSALTIITDGNIGDPPNQGTGGCKVPAIIVWTSGLRKHESQVQQGGGGGGKGGGGGGNTVIQVSYDLDIALMWGRGPLNLLRLYGNADILQNNDPNIPVQSGVYNPAVGADPNYTPATLPDPTPVYTIPWQRMNAPLDELNPGDPGGGYGGPIQGGASQLAVYPGSATQPVDPTIEADIDGRYGAGSTPAYRNHALSVHTQFKLDRWQGLVPNFTAAWQHQLIKNLGAIFAHFCEREGVLLPGDYDFTSVNDIPVRGLLIAGGRYAPASVMDSPELQAMFNFFTTEGEGKILAYENGDEPSVTIPESDFGWLDGDGEVPEIIQKIAITRVKESSLSREVDVRFIDQGNDWDNNLQSAQRRIAAGSELRTIEVTVTAIPDEARTAAQRALYTEYKAGTSYKFQLPWTYLYLYPGYKIITSTADGFSYVFRLTSITGGIGVLECEAVALELDTFNQPAVGSIIPVFNPGQTIPTMTVAIPLNLPRLRPEDLGAGYYIAARPRVATIQSYTGYVLWRKQLNQWVDPLPIIGKSVIGKVVSATALSPDPNTTDNVGEIVVDLYGDGALFSVTESDMIAGANAAAFGNLICRFADATQDPAFPNRWTLSTLRNGQNNTYEHINDNLVNKSFVLIDDTVKFIPIEDGDINNAMVLKAVTFGQSLADAAEITFVPNGESLRQDPVGETSASRHDNDWLISFFGEPANYKVEIWESADRTNPAHIKRTLPVTIGSSHAVGLIGTNYGDTGVVKNSLYCPASPENRSAISAELLEQTFVRVDFNMRWIGPDGTMLIPISITEFIDKAFHGAVNRSATGGEDTTWRSGLTTAYGTSQAALITEAGNLITGLFNSAEYTGLGTSNSVFVEDCYQAFLGRNSDAAGKSFWLTYLGSNSRANLLNAFSVSIEFAERAGVIEPPNTPRRSILVGLQTRASTSPVGGNFEPDLSQCPISIEWSTAGANSGRAHEVIRSFGEIVFQGITTLQYTRHDIDPGFSPTRTQLEIGGRPGPRYTIFLSGTEYRVYANLSTASGQRPIVIVPSPGSGFPFPFRLAAKVRDETTGYMAIENVSVGGSINPTTVYAERDQISDFGAVQNTIYVRIYQVSDVAGIVGYPVDLVATA